VAGGGGGRVGEERGEGVGEGEDPAMRIEKEGRVGKRGGTRRG